MYEHHTSPLLSWEKFLARLIRHWGYAGGLVLVSVALGTLGFHLFAGQAWIDALLNASMLLGGMGPVGEITTTTGKLFASAFALYAGLVFIVAGGIALAPALHRVLHRLHVTESEGTENTSQDQ